MVRWLKINFSEACTAWIHIKALRIFVESVLRYGLPVNFQAAIIKPQKKGSKRLRETLDNLYSYLNTTNDISKKEVILKNIIFFLNFLKIFQSKILA